MEESEQGNEQESEQESVQESEKENKQPQRRLTHISKMCIDYDWFRSIDCLTQFKFII